MAKHLVPEPVCLKYYIMSEKNYHLPHFLEWNIDITHFYDA